MPLRLALALPTALVHRRCVRSPAFPLSLRFVAWMAQPLHVVDGVCAVACEVDDVVLDEWHVSGTAVSAPYWWVLSAVLVTGGGGAVAVAPTHWVSKLAAAPW